MTRAILTPEVVKNGALSLPPTRTPLETMECRSFIRLSKIYGMPIHFTAAYRVERSPWAKFLSVFGPKSTNLDQSS